MHQKYPIGIETFSEIIKGEYAYVDKTELLYRLTQSGKFYFLSRPRRFGKSLMLSTIEAYFEGRRELFDGLWLGHAEGVNWTPRPVLRLNFVSSSSDSTELHLLIDRYLKHWESKYNVTDISNSLAQRFFIAIQTAYESTGQKVAILIDEYDKALINTMHDSELHDQAKSILKPLFSILKDADRFIEFAMLTGVSRFSKLSIFSDINNLEDISFNPAYASICGITEDEVRKYFAPGVVAFAQEMNTDFEGMMQILKDNYDGYHFTRTSPDIYNPFSLINALKNKEITHKWFESGTPTFLMKRISDADEDIKALLSPQISARALANTSIADSDLTILLYESGYLTIKNYNREDDDYTLGVPNKEIASAIYKNLLPLNPE